VVTSAIVTTVPQFHTQFHVPPIQIPLVTSVMPRKKQHRGKRDDPISASEFSPEEFFTITQVRKKSLHDHTGERKSLHNHKREGLGWKCYSAALYRCWLPQSKEGQVSIPFCFRPSSCPATAVTPSQPPFFYAVPFSPKRCVTIVKPLPP